jgi:hypothetical protein
MSSEAWFVVAAAASPILSFGGAAWGSRIAGRADDRLDRWRRREETMRTIRWAAEKAVDHDTLVCEVGYAALEALAASELLQAEDRRFLRRVTEAALGERLETMPPGVDTELVEG